jgi:hypothetical protein
LCAGSDPPFSFSSYTAIMDRLGSDEMYLPYEA